MQLFSQAVPVWSHAGIEASDQYRLFRKKFSLPAGRGRIFLDAAADSTYAVFINGKRLKIQQLAGFPGEMTASQLEITPFLKTGENIIAAEVHYIGERFLTYRPGTAFFCAEIYGDDSVYAATGETWKCIDSPDMLSGLNCKVTGQLGFVFCRDMRKITAFSDIDFDDSSWPGAVKCPGCKNWQFSRRSVPQLEELPRPDVCIRQMGYLKRDHKYPTFAAASFYDFLSPRRPQDFFTLLNTGNSPDDFIRQGIWCRGSGNFEFHLKPLPDNADGYYMIFDTGREHVGLIDLDICVPDGAVIDISHGEHLEDGRVRALTGPRNFTDRLIGSGKRFRMIYPHRRIGARYIELHVTNCRHGEVVLYYAGLTPLELPLPARAGFSSEDRLLDRINEISVDTLKLCMHEHYEDSPWREQALYPYDSRNQILYGYYVWGNYDFARASLDLLGRNFDGERYLELTSPGYSTLTIPVFTMVWICELYEYHLFSGSDELSRKYLGQIDRIIDTALANGIAGISGLYHPGNDSKIWNFSEWNGQLSALKEHPQAPYNIYLYEAMIAAAKLHDMLGSRKRKIFLEEQAATLGKTLEKMFFNRKLHYYTAAAGKEDEGYEHIQAIMLANDLVPENRCQTLWEKLGSGELCSIDLSALYYLVTGMMKGSRESRRYLLSKLRQILEPVVLSGATSLWETRHGASDFNYAGSLCHGWSSVMPYFCGSCILGVSPLAAGFKKFEVKPFCAGLSHARGSIPTPSGMIFVSWQNTGDGISLQIRHPENLECVINCYEECPVTGYEIKTYRNTDCTKIKNI